MGKRGPKKKHPALRLLHGTATIEHIKRLEVEPARVTVDPPKSLSELARVEWEKLAPHAIGIGSLTQMDVDPFADMCECRARVEQAEAEIRKDGITIEGKHQDKIRHPAITIAKQYRDHLIKYYDRFGFGPTARAGIPMAPKKDALTELLARHKK